MPLLRFLSIAMITLLALGTSVAPIHAQSPERVVTLNGDITEIMFALGLEDYVVAVDASSNYPEAVQSLPNVGYQGRLSAEAILAFEPTRVIANKDAGPAAVLDQLRAAGVEVTIVETENSLDTPVNNIRTVAALFGEEERGEALAQEVAGKIAEAAKRGSELARTPRVLFLYLGSARTQFAGGANTPAHAMILGAGAIDAGAEAGIVGYVPITPEALVTANPDVLIITDRGVATLGSPEGVFQIPGIAQTPAGQAQRLIVFEDLYFIGMGPRTGDALMELVEFLHQVQ